ncbi:MAG TPA: hypothetical protein VGP07_05955 [Polyangia bacterium]|jgi:hypothetical protein
MDDVEIARFARAELERLDGAHSGPAYRCAAILKDGLHLPCVLLASTEATVALALRRFEETRNDGALPESKRRFGYGMQYADIVKSFVASGNTINSYDIARLEKSKYAIPLARLHEVRGETSMSWTQFAAVMRDGREFAFGTSFLTEFFQMPEGYSGDDIAAITSHKAGDPTYRERPYFTCYVNGL